MKHAEQGSHDEPESQPELGVQALSLLKPPFSPADGFLRRQLIAVISSIATIIMFTGIFLILSSCYYCFCQNYMTFGSSRPRHGLGVLLPGVGMARQILRLFGWSPGLGFRVRSVEIAFSGILNPKPSTTCFRLAGVSLPHWTYVQCPYPKFLRASSLLLQ